MISVIIPLAPFEDKWKELVSQLSELPTHCEILLVVGIGEEVDTSAFNGVRTVEGADGRAGRMNSGAEASKNDFLWFLHADSRLASDTIEKLMAAYKKEPDALYYNDLKFMDDGPKLIKLNEIMVGWRSNILKMPFGDQGFAISKGLFFKLGGYRDDVPYGEDYVFTWKMKQEGYSILPTGTQIYTSARKYEKGGWLRVTALHVWLTIKQGFPEFITWIRKRFS